MELRKLNTKGIEEFSEYLRGGADGAPPHFLLERPETSEPVMPRIKLPEDLSAFPNRYVFGNRLVELLKGIEGKDLAQDRGLWTGLALFWFDFICPVGSGGKRKISKEYHYILSTDYRHYYRHLVRSSWQLVRTHGENAKLLLIPPKKTKYPLAVHGEILEQFGGRQQVLASREIMVAAYRMFFDPIKGRPKTGVAGNGKGSARRFGLVFRQFDLTFDLPGMSPEAVVALLPKEFDKWKPGA